MIVGIHSRDNDLVVNAVRAKQLTNFRVSRQGRRDQDHAADRPDAGVRGRVHRGRRAGRDHAEDHSPAQALPEGARPQAGFARGGVTLAVCAGERSSASPFTVHPLPPPSGGCWLDRRPGRFATLRNAMTHRRAVALMIAVHADVEHRRRRHAPARCGAQLRGHVLAQPVQRRRAVRGAAGDARPGRTVARHSQRRASRCGSRACAGP